MPALKQVREKILVERKLNILNARQPVLVLPRWIWIFSPTLLVFLLTSCDYVKPNPFVTWKEEVSLNDGRIIVVEQKKRRGGLMARESWLSINLPEFSPQPIVWHENLLPLVLNIDEGKLYVVGFPSTDAEFEEYGKPRPIYVGFLLERGKWSRIPFNKIPEKIYKTNMLLDDFPPKGTEFLTLSEKNGSGLNGNARIVPVFLKIDPNWNPGR